MANGDAVWGAQIVDRKEKTNLTHEIYSFQLSMEVLELSLWKLEKDEEVSVS